MATTQKRRQNRKKRSLFSELMSGVAAMRDHREGRLTLKTREVRPIAVPPIDPDVVRETREALKMSRHVFAFKLGVNPRTLERWEQGRSAERAGRSPDLAGTEVPRYPEAPGIPRGFGLKSRWSPCRQSGA
jgi:putative transcriptional regulator